MVRQDSRLRGWNWTPGTASWVEPTAHALLLLRMLPPETLPSPAARGRQLAEQMLFDRMCPGGGWNSGNPLIYGVAGVLLGHLQQEKIRQLGESVVRVRTPIATLPAMQKLLYKPVGDFR